MVYLKNSMASGKKDCTFIAFDIKNDFNTAKWSHILNALQNMQVPSYLDRIISIYFTDRKPLDDTTEGPKDYTFTSRVPHGSVLGSLFMYDSILRQKNPRGTTIIGYADDIVIAKKLLDMGSTCASMISSVSTWLQKAGLELCLFVVVKKWSQSKVELEGM